jgi:hypothetical protein
MCWSGSPRRHPAGGGVCRWGHRKFLHDHRARKCDAIDAPRAFWAAAGIDHHDCLCHSLGIARDSEFIAELKMLRVLGSGTLQAISNEANAGRLDQSNQLIDFHLRLRIKGQRDRSSDQQR